jgi:putative FmdB family regulatory protein
MPIYDYTCSACRRTTEVVHGINDHGPRFCPECGAKGTMKKDFTAAAVHFKGSGWAKKDRGSAARSAASSKDDETKPADAKTDKAASDAGSSTAPKPKAGGDEAKPTDRPTRKESTGSSSKDSSSTGSTD